MHIAQCTGIQNTWKTGEKYSNAFQASERVSELVLESAEEGASEACSAEQANERYKQTSEPISEWPIANTESLRGDLNSHNNNNSTLNKNKF